MTDQAPAGLRVTDEDGVEVDPDQIKALQVETRPRRYRVLLPLTVHVADGSYAQGDEFEQAFTPEDEWAHFESGLLGLVPEYYEVTGDCEIEINLVEVPASFELRKAQPGETFRAAIPLAREKQLRFHVRSVPPPAANKGVIRGNRRSD